MKLIMNNLNVVFAANLILINFLSGVNSLRCFTSGTEKLGSLRVSECSHELQCSITCLTLKENTKNIFVKYLGNKKTLCVSSCGNCKKLQRKFNEDYKPIGYELDMNFPCIGCFTDFCNKNYNTSLQALSKNENAEIKLKKGNAPEFWTAPLLAGSFTAILTTVIFISIIMSSV